MILILTLTSCKSHVSSNKYDDAKDYKVGNQTYKETISKVEINWACGEVKIVESSSTTINITETGLGLKYDKKVHSLVKDGTLYVQFWRSGLKSSVDGKDKCVTIQIPSGKNIKVDAGSATIKSDKLTGNNIELETVSGEINIKEIKCKTCKIETSSGNIVLNKTTASKSFAADVTSGMLNINSIDASNIDIDDVSGSIDMKIESATNINIRATSSKVNLGFPSNFGSTLTYKTTSGKFGSSPIYKTVGSKRVFGDGSCNIYVKTVSGDLKIE